jgi:riboflavin synthase
MFTGLVETVGTLCRVITRGANRRLIIQADFAPELNPGDSVAVNGCCLTVTATAKDRFEVEATAATLRQTTLGTLKTGARLNLERARRLGERLGGHIILGHIDEVGRVRHRLRTAGETRLVIAVQPANLNLIVPRGSIAIDGVSLTIQELGPGRFTVNLIPYTLENTTLKDARPGTAVNIEYDIIVKSARTGTRPAALPI